MKLLYIFLLFALPITTSAQDFSSRVKAAYELNDNNYDIECFYSRPSNFKLISAVSKTLKSSNQLSREFILETDSGSIPLSFKLTRSSTSIDYEIIINKVHSSSSKLKTRNFSIASIADQSFAKTFETSKINCSVNFADAEPVILTEGDYHFSVHPHTIYDWASKLKTPIETYLNNNQFNSMIFLESNNERGNQVDIHDFFDLKGPRLTLQSFKSDLQNVPENTPMIVSPSGNARMRVATNGEVNITFSGGNHNYCIWNTTRQVLLGLMKSKSTAVINFNYDTKAIVAQQRGMEGLNMNFNRGDVNKSNLLFDLLSKTQVQTGYHFSYLIFFRNLFAQEYSGMYKTFKVNYQAPGYNESFTMNGTGSRDLEVNYNYL